MKKITLLASLTALTAFGQQPTTASEYIENGLHNLESPTSSISRNTLNNQPENITLFATKEEYLANCANGEFLTFEDFAGGPNEDFEGCGIAISAAGDECFPSGEIQEDVVFTNSGADVGATMIFINSGPFFGIEDPGVSSDNFFSSTIVNFTADTSVTSVGFDLYSPIGEGLIDIRIFGITSGLLETITFDASNVAQFVGFTTEEPLERIELQNLDNVLIETVAQFYFGNCEALNIEENTFGNFNFFPNPTQNAVTISSTVAVEKISIYNLLGQKVKSQTVNSTTSNIDVSNLKTGVYILEVTSNGQVGTFKMIKE